MNTTGIDQLLQELNATAAKASGAGENSAAEVPDFGEMLKSALDTVHDAQTEAARLQTEFDQGAPNANLHEVMVSLQKASLSFQTMVQVRNRLVSAYQEIMNMSV
ncbi:MAG: flagellar hook-basal body complex protein FliE [Betaproteobacteria bacterium]|nr:flagellar hook-basal body complex protein FliE [Betaproteobacteria bacterium]